MRLSIVGAGAIGGLLGHRLATSGHSVRLVARGAQLRAIQDHGLTLIKEDGVTETIQIEASEQIGGGACDVIILGMKAHQVADVAPAVAAALTDETIVVTAQNGIPWWYFVKHGGQHEGRRLESVDPEGKIAAHLPAERIIGSVVYPAAEIVAPGVIRHVEGNRFSISEIDGADTPRVRALSDALTGAGFKAPVVSDIRTEIWTKLWGNLSFNPISALTHATLEDICRHPQTRALATGMMREAQAVAESLGVRFRISLEKRLAGAEAVGAHKTSMLQDVEAGRPLEVEALIGSVAELGQITGIATPHIDSIYAATSLLNATLASEQALLKLQAK
jgi:2-dehydropantoate 2-reductase